MGETSKDIQAHVLNCDKIEELDEVNGESQLCWVWCETHRRFEWHSLPLDRVDGGGKLTTQRRPVSW